jgi:hypothetical protein
MEFYLPELVFKFFKVELNKKLSIIEVDKLFYIKNEEYIKFSTFDKGLLNIAILIIKNSISEAKKNNFDYIIFLKQFIALENDFLLLPFYGKKSNPYILVSSYEELTDMDFTILNRIRKNIDFCLIDLKIFTDILNKEVKEN